MKHWRVLLHIVAFHTALIGACHRLHTMTADADHSDAPVFRDFRARLTNVVAMRATFLPVTVSAFELKQLDMFDMLKSNKGS
jgi:hypothetical protein